MKIKNLIYVLIIFFLIIFSYIYVIKKYDYIYRNELMDGSVIIETEEENVIPDSELNKFKKQVIIRDYEPQKNDVIWTSFKLTNLKPLDKVTINFQIPVFKIKNGTEISVLTQYIKPKEKITSSGSDFSSNNIDISSATTFTKENQKFINVTLDVHSDINGISYLLVGVNSSGLEKTNDYYEYDIGTIRMEVLDD